MINFNGTNNKIIMNDLTYNKIFGETICDSKFTANSFNVDSDIRLKKNIVDYHCNNSILDLNVKEFDFIDSGIHTIGCIAQDLQKICPEIVYTNKQGYLSIDENKLVYLLLDEVKKLRQELDVLKGNNNG